MRTTDAATGDRSLRWWLVREDGVIEDAGPGGPDDDPLSTCGSGR
jgi:hypothetical protein